MAKKNKANENELSSGVVKINECDETPNYAVEDLKAEIDRLRKDACDLEKSIETVRGERDGLAKKVADLEAEVRRLTTENDGYLLKIAELSFQNARLQSAAVPAQKNAVRSALSDGNETRRPWSRDINGYDSWN